ncbi:hypothetical protein PXH59_02630 [Xenorhabdus sp. SF857]|uniref:hypothetical protein n=1 Tax=Xenorhabdus bakwenae TaxID=3026967 RepID=UPI002557F261|nr:hypothetical protein [Xenorhabdus sp. SF857]WFQ80095.1 hypothetical protein PXH59_02630 [Xenorhabdus sp. SF857]
MQKMLYKPNGDVNVWGMQLQVIVIDSDELDNYLAEGWVEHPNETLSQKPSATDSGAGKTNLGKGQGVKDEPDNQG